MKPLPARPKNRALLVASTALGRHAARAAIALEDLELVEVCVRGGGLEAALRRRRIDRVVIELTPDRPELLAEVLGARARAGRPEVPLCAFSVGDASEVTAVVEALTGLGPEEAASALRVWAADLGTLAPSLGAASLARLSAHDAPPAPESHHSYRDLTVIDVDGHDTIVEVA